MKFSLECELEDDGRWPPRKFAPSDGLECRPGQKPGATLVQAKARAQGLLRVRHADMHAPRRVG